MDDNGIITKPTWFFGTILVNTQENANIDDVPSLEPLHIYYINTVPNTLMVKRVFTINFNDKYTCSPTSNSHTTPKADTITLATVGEYFDVMNILQYIVIHSKDIIKICKIPQAKISYLGLKAFYNTPNPLRKYKCLRYT